MWINPNGDELEVSGTYDINFKYEKIDESAFTHSEYSQLYYYFELQQNEKSYLNDPESGCHIVYDDDWETILAKYKAGQTLVFNLSVDINDGDDNTIVWKIPCVASMINDNDEGVFIFVLCDGSYVYMIQITNELGSQNAEVPYYAAGFPISSMPEVDDETITIDETTGKLRTTYGDETIEEVTYYEGSFLMADSAEIEITKQDSSTQTVIGGFGLLPITDIKSTSPKIQFTFSNDTTITDDLSVNHMENEDVSDLYIRYNTDISIDDMMDLINDKYDSEAAAAIDWSDQMAGIVISEGGMTYFQGYISEDLYENLESIKIFGNETLGVPISSNALRAGNGISIGENATINCSYGEYQEKVDAEKSCMINLTSFYDGEESGNSNIIQGLYYYFYENSHDYWRDSPSNADYLTPEDLISDQEKQIAVLLSGAIDFKMGSRETVVSPSDILNWDTFTLEDTSDSTILTMLRNLEWIYSETAMGINGAYCGFYGTDNTISEILNGTWTVKTGYDFTFGIVMTINFAEDGHIRFILVTPHSNFAELVENSELVLIYPQFKKVYNTLPPQALPGTNNINPTSSSVIFGYSNEIQSNYSDNNLICGRYNILSYEGENNLISGAENNINGDKNIVGGQDNNIKNTYQTIICGSQNSIGNEDYSNNNNIVTGQYNNIYMAENSLIIGNYIRLPQESSNNSCINLHNSIICGESHTTPTLESNTDRNISNAIIGGSGANLKDGIKLAIGSGYGSNILEVFETGIYSVNYPYYRNYYGTIYTVWDSSLALSSSYATLADTATDTSDIVTKYNDLVSKYNALVLAFVNAGIIQTPPVQEPEEPKE